MKRLVTPLVAIVLAASCSGPKVESGVSWELAQQRREVISEVTYGLSFRIPEGLQEPCQGSVTISFTLSGKMPVQVDFRQAESSVKSLSINGKDMIPDCRQEHIVLPRKALRKGVNTVSISFTPEDASLNRHADYLYSLLVPERARTVFPCFDQPDLKARYVLDLDIPADWVAVSNGPVLKESTEGLRKHISFAPSDLLSTYLFEFTAGRWQMRTFCRGEAPMTVYYRETDPAKLAQLPDIQRQIEYALDWMEDYTGIPMPFQKYDYVIVPGFQFGGMEHPGAILFNDTKLFLKPSPTDEEILARMDLLSHETAHLWFGDAVTMQWFGDVWTKEVFANHFASMITRPLFPGTDYRLKDFKAFNIPAYDEDRTAGTTPIRQHLDNLGNAGLIYGNIVYDKAPVVMRMLADTLGAEPFREGLQEYLHAHLFANATWPDLISALDRHTDADLAAWSREWVEGKGMPQHAESDTLANLDALGYGYYPLTDKGLDISIRQLASLPKGHQRISTLANLYENMLHGRLEPTVLARTIGSLLGTEQDPLVASAAMKYLGSIASDQPQVGPQAEKLLTDIASDSGIQGQIRLQAFRRLAHIYTSPEADRIIYSTWKERSPLPGLTLSEEDYTNLAMELAIRHPEEYQTIVSAQRSRIGHPDRLARFDFIVPATSPVRAVRDSVFSALLEKENRLTEPWAEDALALLNHPLRSAEALGYIAPALDELQEIQRTGDIFFPKAWLSALLAGHRSPEAAAIVRDWLSAHPHYPPLLKNKLLQVADPLLRN